MKILLDVHSNVSQLFGFSGSVLGFEVWMIPNSLFLEEFQTLFYKK